jgi:lipoate-protein ligase A
MALDEALLLCARQDLVTLRLYAWSPATVSLGYFQRRASVPEEVAGRYPLVRRPTGGGALIHERDEITFSITGLAPRRAPRPAETAALAFEGLRRGLAFLEIEPFLRGTDPAPEGASRIDPRSLPFFCGAIGNPLDVLVHLPGGPRKLVGTSQRRHGRAWLIHGGLPVGLRPPESALLEGSGVGTSVVEVLASKVDPHQATDLPALRERIGESLIEGFSAALGTCLDPGQASQEEIDRANRLLASRYASPIWAANKGK